VLLTDRLGCRDDYRKGHDHDDRPAEYSDPSGHGFEDQAYCRDEQSDRTEPRDDLSTNAARTPYRYSSMCPGLPRAIRHPQ
jgi:hypothetical protein